MFKLGIKSSSLQLCTVAQEIIVFVHHIIVEEFFLQYKIHENSHVSVAHMIRLSLSRIYNAAFDIVQRNSFKRKI